MIALRRTDLLWLLLIPVYLVSGTIRHESAHAAVAIAQGAMIIDWSILPGTANGTFFFGYVAWEGGDVTWLATAAPYFADLATVAIGLALLGLAAVRDRHQVAVNLFIVTIVTPMVNSTYQYVKTVLLDTGDLGALMAELPAATVHAWFLVTLPLYFAATYWVIRHQPPAGAR